MACMASPPAVAGGCSTSAITTAKVTGSHVLRINNYFESRAYGAGSYIRSSKFVAAGHSWIIRYYPVGLNQETGDCIAFYLVLGGWSSVRAQFRFSLLDPEGNQPVHVHSLKSSCPVAFHGSRSIWGFRKFINREDLEKSNYLRDNSFWVVCDITVVNGFHREGTTMFVHTAPPPSYLDLDLGRMLASGIGADVKLKVRDVVFPAHRNVLAARSPVFMAEFFGPLKEEEPANSLEIHDMEPVVFRAMLGYIYADITPQVRTGEEIAMAQHLLVAADRYDLKRLKLICEQKLCSRITKKTAAITLVLAEQHGCSGLKKACFGFLLSLGSLKAAMDTEGYDHLRSSCPYLHDELVAKFDASKRSKIRSFLCFSVN